MGIDPGNPEFVHTNTILSIAVQKFIFETKRSPNWFSYSPQINAVTELGNIINNQASLGFMFNKLCLYVILGHPVPSMSKPTKLLDQIFLPSM